MSPTERLPRQARDRGDNRSNVLVTMPDVEWEILLSVIASVERFLEDRDRGIRQGRYRADSNDLDIHKEEAMRDELRGLLRMVAEAPKPPATAAGTEVASG